MTSNEIQKVKSTAFQSLSVLMAAMVFARQPLSPLPPIRPMSACLCLLTASTSNVNLFVPQAAIQPKPSIGHTDF